MHDLTRRRSRRWVFDIEQIIEQGSVVNHRPA
jgi:hypothetical protein